MTKQELVTIIKDNFTNKNGVVGISEMDFGDTSVDINKLKTNGNLFHDFQKAKVDLSHDFQDVKVDLSHDFQDVKVDLFHDFQDVKVDLSHDFQEAKKIVN